MFATHKYFNAVGSIELSVTIENRELSQHHQTPQPRQTPPLFSQTQYEFEHPSLTITVHAVVLTNTI